MGQLVVLTTQRGTATEKTKKREEGAIAHAELDAVSFRTGWIPVVLKWFPVVPVVPVVTRPVVVPAPVVTVTPNFAGSAETLKQFSFVEAH